MTAQILVGNLPENTSSEDVVEIFRQWGAEVEAKIEGDPDRVTAVVTLDVDQKTARLMVDRAKDYFYKGKTLSFYAPLMMDGEKQRFSVALMCCGRCGK